MGNKNKKKLKKLKQKEKLKETIAFDEAESKENGSKEKSTHSIDALLDKAEQLIDEFNLELAQKFCKRALEMEPDNVRALETSASLLLELGDAESAKHCLGRAVTVVPDVGFTKYMTLGQLLSGGEAVQCYQKGIELMLKEKEEKEAQEVSAACRPPPAPVSAQDVSSAYCAVAELYMTDCCHDDDAETKCKEFVDKAVTADPENAEAWLVKSNFLMSMDEKEEAKVAIKKSVSIWLPKLQTVDKNEAALEDFDPVEVCSLPFTARVQSGRTLIEVEEYDAATDVLETLLDEDDEVAEVWYLLGWANFLHGSDYHANARHYLAKANEVYKKTKQEDPQLIAHVTELLAELGPENTEEMEDGPGEELNLSSSDEEDMDQ